VAPEQAAVAGMVKALRTLAADVVEPVGAMAAAVAPLHRLLPQLRPHRLNRLLISN
jgi:hypothetical protein